MELSMIDFTLNGNVDGVNKCLGHLERLGIARELTSRKRNRVFSYAGYLEIMNQGTELPG